MENNSFKTSVTTSIVPFLTVKNATKAISFYTRAMGAVVTTQSELSNGGIVAGLSIGGASFWVGDEEPEFDNNSPRTEGGSGVRIILTINDPDILFANALGEGARQICPVTTEESWRIGKLADPFGHIWEIGYPL